MKSLFLPKYERNIVKISALYCTVPHYRAEILTIFCSYFGRNDDFINSFWNLLTFRKAYVWLWNYRLIDQNSWLIQQCHLLLQLQPEKNKPKGIIEMPMTSCSRCMQNFWTMEFLFLGKWNTIWWFYILTFWPDYMSKGKNKSITGLVDSSGAAIAARARAREGHHCGAPPLPPPPFILLNRGKTEVLPVLPPTAPLDSICLLTLPGPGRRGRGGNWPLSTV